MCHLVERETALASTPAAVVVLNRFPLRWGHMLVVLRRHVVTFGDLADAEYDAATGLALRAARALERAFVPPPARVYVASLGTAIEGLPMTSPHLHFHVVPVLGAGERPSEVLSWSEGVLDGTPEEWRELRDALQRALDISRS
jgi:diadenosine tetraphosphate (Ap4A) HIT family hydrolase